MKIVIRAGGVGTRLWPISRKKNPKQFQVLVNDKSMIRNTVDRVKTLLENVDDFFISVNENLTEKLKKEIPELPEKNIIAEPASRNTGPAMCLESCILAKRFGEDVIVASLTSDDYISDASAFCEMLKNAEQFLEKNPAYVVTSGVKPDYPDTGYSYIKVSESLGGDGMKIFRVVDWVEKPDIDQCKKIIVSGEYFCHTGIYIWKLETILDLFKRFQPKMYEACKRLAAGKETDYSVLEKITIETAVTSRAPKIATIISNRIGWSDLGKWHIIARVLPVNQNSNLTKGKVLTLDTKDCLIYGQDDKLIATVGLENMVIVLTNDALLVCPKERSDEVRKIVKELEKRGMKEYL